MSRAKQVFELLDAVTLGGVSARMKNEKVFANAIAVWDAQLANLSQERLDRIIHRIPTEIKSFPSLADVLALGKASWE